MFFFRQLYPGSNPVAHSVGVGRARRAQKAPVYWMQLGLPFMTPRVYANCSEPLPCHRKYSTSDQQTVLVYLQASLIPWVYRTQKFITLFTTNLYTQQSTRIRLHYLRPDLNTLTEPSSQVRLLNVSKTRMLDATLFTQRVQHFSSKSTSLI
jgi:hypothetical protein